MLNTSYLGDCVLVHQYSTYKNKAITRKTGNYCTKDLTHEDYLKKRQMKYALRKKQEARTRFLIVFFTVFGLLLPFIFFNNLNNLFLKKFNNKYLKIPAETSFLSSAEFSIADDTFLDTRFIGKINTQNPIMSSPALTGEMRGLTRRIRNIMASYPRLKPGIFIWDYATGKYVAINADKTYSAASIIKIPILYQLFRRVEKGVIDLNDAMSTSDPFISSGSGALQYFPLGTTLTYKRLAELMIQESDNTASNMLLAVTGGMNELNRNLKHWGVSRTQFYNWLPDLKGTNITTPLEMGKMIYNVDNPDFLSLKSRAEIVEILGHTKNRYLIQQPLPHNVKFLHKTGDIGPMLGDAGIVILPDGGKYLIVIMVNRPWNCYSAKQFIIEVSDEAYRSISRK